MESVDESSILKPGNFFLKKFRSPRKILEKLHFLIGMKIKPQVDDSAAKEIVQRIYGIKAIEICELNAYDDKNFLIYADK